MNKLGQTIENLTDKPEKLRTLKDTTIRFEVETNRNRGTISLRRQNKNKIFRNENTGQKSRRTKIETFTK